MCGEILQIGEPMIDLSGKCPKPSGICRHITRPIRTIWFPCFRLGRINFSSVKGRLSFDVRLDNAWIKFRPRNTAILNYWWWWKETKLLSSQKSSKFWRSRSQLYRWRMCVCSALDHTDAFIVDYSRDPIVKPSLGITGGCQEMSLIKASVGYVVHEHGNVDGDVWRPSLMHIK